MKFLSNINDMRYRSSYFFWIGAFFACLIGLCLLLYAATIKIDYVWHWFDVPKYFFGNERVEVRAAIAGQVKAIYKEGEGQVVQVVGDGETATYPLKGADADETIGVQIVRRALEEPIRQIVSNAGLEGSVIVARVKEGKADFGYNAYSDEYTNLIEAGVIDPTKVSRVALENAASVAGLLITTESTIVEKKEDAPPAPHNHGGGMGDMY